jgi:hypothetical protein
MVQIQTLLALPNFNPADQCLVLVVFPFHLLSSREHWLLLAIGKPLMVAC